MSLILEWVTLNLFFFLFFHLQDIDIKKVNGVPQYAFVQYSDIASVCKAIKKMDGEYLGSNRLKVMEAMVPVQVYILVTKLKCYIGLIV